jgi:hypothetical protein
MFDTILSIIGCSIANISICLMYSFRKKKHSNNMNHANRMSRQSSRNPLLYSGARTWSVRRGRRKYFNY